MAQSIAQSILTWSVSLELYKKWLVTISALRGPENLGSAPAPAMVGEHSGAFGMRFGSAPNYSPGDPDPSDPNEEVPKTGALQSAPGFLGPP
ncbi:hypothetical protein RHS03_08821, partial [Rhizoctonia solani]